MSTLSRPHLLACASLALAMGPPATAAALEAIAYVEYDAAAPLDPARSYGCLADARLGAGLAGTRQLTCSRRVPLAELCGTTDGGQLPADCPFVPGSTGIGAAPTAAQLETLADALLGHFQGHQPKLNFAAERLSRGGRAAYEMNWQPGAPGSSPSVGAWNEAPPAARNVRPTALQIEDPDSPDSRYGNADWVNPSASPAEWNALLDSPTLDHVYRASRNLLATQSAPNPPAAAVRARAESEVAKCRDASLGLLGDDIEFHLGRAAGPAGARPSGTIRQDCLADPGPPRLAQTPARPPVTQNPVRPPQRPVNPVRPPATPPPGPSTQNPVRPPATQNPVRPPQRPVNPVTQTPVRPPVTPPPGPSTQNPVTPPVTQNPVRPPQRPVNPVTQAPVRPPATPPPGPSTQNPARPPATQNPARPRPTKRCWDGSVIDFAASCPPSTKRCPDGSTVHVNASCPVTSTQTQTTTTYKDCKGNPHSTQAAANAVSCAPRKKYTACDGSKHSTQAAASAVSCAPRKKYTACDGSKHSTQAAANAVSCVPRPPAVIVPPPTPPPGYTPPSTSYAECQGGPSCPYNGRHGNGNGSAGRGNW